MIKLSQTGMENLWQEGHGAANLPTENAVQWMKDRLGFLSPQGAHGPSPRGYQLL